MGRHITEKPFEKGSYPLSKGKLKNLKFSLLHLWSNKQHHCHKKIYTMRNQVIVLFQGKLFFGWFNENITNTIAAIYIITPIILDIFYSCNTHLSNRKLSTCFTIHNNTDRYFDRFHLSYENLSVPFQSAQSPVVCTDDEHEHCFPLQH